LTKTLKFVSTSNPLKNGEESMKMKPVTVALILAACCARGQGTLEYDQQVSPTNAPGVFNNIQPGPTGQSFVPGFSAVGFVELYLKDVTFFNGIGATVYVNLWSDSLTNGTLLGTTAATTMPDVFGGTTNFLFTAPVAVSPGTTYFLEAVIQSGDSFQIGVVSSSRYTNGMAFFQGVPNPNASLWFREGLVVPEPSSVLLIFFGFIGLYPILWRRNLK
jgi:hypothetical protein